MYPKILSFITIQDSQKRHRIIFKNIREIGVTYSGQKAHWYSTELKIHPNDLVFGWSCVGSHAQIDSILKSIRIHESLLIEGTSYSLSDLFSAAKTEILLGENSFVGTPSIIEKYKTTLLYLTESDWLQNIGSHCRELLEETFCNHISGLVDSGYKYCVISPSGFWRKNEILEFFQAHVFEVREEIQPYIEFRGVGPRGHKDIQGFKGLCLQFPRDWKNVQINFLDIERKQSLYRGDIALKEGWGEWEFKFEGAPGKGVIEIFHAQKLVGTSSFYLILDISVDVKPMGGGALFQDAYGRKIGASKKEVSGVPPKSVNWNSEFMHKPQVLSDELVKTLSHLGEEVLFQDPYFVGVIDGDEKITPGTLSFLNALSVAIVNYNLKRVKILLDNRKLKMDSDAKRNLKMFLEKTLRPLVVFGLESVEIAYANSSFHDRYFLSVSNPNLIYHVSKSVNGYLESDDFNIYLYDGNQKKELTSQILYRFNKAAKERVLG